MAAMAALAAAVPAASAAEVATPTCRPAVAEAIELVRDEVERGGAFPVLYGTFTPTGRGSRFGSVWGRATRAIFTFEGFDASDPAATYLTTEVLVENACSDTVGCGRFPRTGPTLALAARIGERLVVRSDPCFPAFYRIFETPDAATVYAPGDPRPCCVDAETIGTITTLFAAAAAETTAGAEAAADATVEAEDTTDSADATDGRAPAAKASADATLAAEPENAAEPTAATLKTEAQADAAQPAEPAAENEARADEGTAPAQQPADASKRRRSGRIETDRIPARPRPQNPAAQPSQREPLVPLAIRRGPSRH